MVFVKEEAFVVVFYGIRVIFYFLVEYSQAYSCIQV